MRLTIQQFGRYLAVLLTVLPWMLAVVQPKAPKPETSLSSGSHAPTPTLSQAQPNLDAPNGSPLLLAVAQLKRDQIWRAAQRGTGGATLALPPARRLHLMYAKWQTDGG